MVRCGVAPQYHPCNTELHDVAVVHVVITKTDVCGSNVQHSVSVCTAVLHLLTSSHKAIHVYRVDTLLPPPSYQATLTVTACMWRMLNQLAS